MKQKYWETVCWVICLFSVSVVPVEFLILTIPLYSLLWWTVLAVNAVAMPIVTICFALEMHKRKKEKLDKQAEKKE